MNIGKTEIPYPAFVMIGTVLWQLFVDSLNAPLKIVSSNKTMLVKINFPREALILSAIAQTMFDYLIRLIIIAFVFILYQIPLTWGLPLAIVGSIMIMVLGIMIGLLITPLGILYTDVNSTLTTVISMWFFATPVVYPPPQRWPYSLLINLNPISPLLVGTRDLLINGTLSNPLPFIAVSFLAFLFLLMMWVFYRISIPILAERMSA